MGGTIAVIAATTTPVGAISLLQIAKFAQEPSTPMPLHQGAGDSDEPAASKLQERSTQLVQPEAAELPEVHWATVCFGSIRAVSLASFCCLRTSGIQCRSSRCVCEEPFGPIVEIHGVSPIDNRGRGSIVPSRSIA